MKPTPDAEVDQWLDAFEGALAGRDLDDAVTLFAEESYWRDLVSFTWNLKTCEGRDEIRAMLAGTLAHVEPKGFVRVGPANEADGVTDAWVDFETSQARGHGHLRLRDGKAWTLLTTMTELKGFEEQRGSRRTKGVDHGVVQGRKSWMEKKTQHEQEFGRTEQPYVVVVGGGQGGIALASRLKRLGVPTIVLERRERPGDSWRSRYKSLHLHDPVWYDHLPFLKFPDHWPVFASKDKIGDWLEHYTRIMELDYWSSTECERATWDEENQEWQVLVNKAGEELTLRPKHLVFALGVSGFPNIPKFEGADAFKGEQHHSSQHPGGERYRGKKAVVIGSNNSAHDICAALWEHEADVTMVQRSSTHIARSDSLMDLALGDLYSEQALANGITTEKADLIFASVPYRILPSFQIPTYDAMKERDKAFYADLEKAGFQLDFGVDGSGLFVKYLRRGSGYYIDVGASQLIIDGSVKLAHGEVSHLTEASVVLEDGTELPADVVVYATGYGSMNGWLEKLVSPEVADRVGKCWGFGSNTPKDPGPWEGELRNMWKPTNVDNLWIHGGNLHQSRHYSQFLSLQLKARYEGLGTPVYAVQESHHKR
jgi:putative flavoprotein involved in K+ transport